MIKLVALSKYAGHNKEIFIAVSHLIKKQYGFVIAELSVVFPNITL